MRIARKAGMAGVMIAALAGAAPAQAEPGTVGQTDVPKERAKMAMAYCDYAYKGVPSSDPLLLAASVRAFGGALKDLPIRLYAVQGKPLPPETAEKAVRLGVELRSYAAEPSLSSFPFARKSLAAAAAERDAEGEAEVLLWLDRDSLVLGDPSALELPEGKVLGYRPVNARNIGLPAAEPLDPFWTRAYALGGLDPAAAGATTPYMDPTPLHFYMAAGLVATRPERGILRRWAELCLRYAADPALSAMCRKNQSQFIFMHQAALSVAAAALVPPDERLEYAEDVMYPLNFWTADDEARRPARIESVRSLRYDATFESEDWRSLPMGEEFRAWLAANLR